MDVTLLLPPGSPLLADWFMRVTQSLVVASATSTHTHSDDEAPPHAVRSVQFVNASVPLVTAVVDNVKVDVSANKAAALVTVAFLEEVDACVGRGHLFKRSLLLVKVRHPSIELPCTRWHALTLPCCARVAPQAWCLYESPRLCGGAGVLDSHSGTLCTYAVEVLVLGVFNAYASVIRHPVHVLALFFYMYAEFPWDMYTVTVQGPVHSFTGEQDFTWNEAQPRFFTDDLLAK